MKTHTLIVLVLLTPLLVLSAGDSMSSGGSDNATSSGSSGSSKYDKSYKKGQAAQKREKYADAVKYYRQALKAKPKDADALNNLGFSLRSIGKQYMVEAAKAYDGALKSNANHEDALEYQGELYLWMGDLGKANANLKKLEKMNSDEAAELRKEIDAILAQAKKLI
jgi:Flp pilus assembly protein TadD